MRLSLQLWEIAGSDTSLNSATARRITGWQVAHREVEGAASGTQLVLAALWCTGAGNWGGRAVVGADKLGVNEEQADGGAAGGVKDGQGVALAAVVPADMRAHVSVTDGRWLSLVHLYISLQ